MLFHIENWQVYEVNLHYNSATCTIKILFSVRSACSYKKQIFLGFSDSDLNWVSRGLNLSYFIPWKLSSVFRNSHSICGRQNSMMAPMIPTPCCIHSFTIFFLECGWNLWISWAINIIIVILHVKIILQMQLRILISWFSAFQKGHYPGEFDLITPAL